MGVHSPNPESVGTAVTQSLDDRARSVERDVYVEVVLIIGRQVYPVRDMKVLDIV